MPQLTNNHFKILNNPLLLDKWYEFHFPTLKIHLSLHFNEELLNDVFNENDNGEAAAKRLQLQILETDDDHLFTSITTYCLEKCQFLSELIYTMWVDVEDESDILDETCPLTKEQRKNLFQRSSDLGKKFDSCLDSKIISSLLNEFACDDNVPPNGESLHEMLTFTNSRQFYNKVCKLLKKELDKYKDCYDFMTNENVSDDEELTTNCTHHHNHELTLFKSQLNNVEKAIGCVVREFTDEMSEMKQEMTKHWEEKFKNQCDSLKETAVALDKMCCQLLNENKQLRDELEKQKRQNRAEQVAMKAEMKNELTAHAELIRNLQETIVLQEQKINNFLKQTKEMEGKMNDLMPSQTQMGWLKSRIDLRPPFPLEPTLVMKEIQETFTHKESGLSPIFANEWGIYSTINWQTLGGTRNWANEWQQIVQKNRRKGYLHLPPFLLPVELGGWCIRMWITWDDGLKLRGCIIQSIPYNATAPDSRDFKFVMNFQVKEIPPIVMETVCTVAKQELSFWTISATIDKEWQLPQMTIQIKR